jgi:hypothetical protein
MVAKYYLAIRPQTNKNHAVHKEGCPFLPENDKRIFLGRFNSGHEAVKEGRRHFLKTNSCLFCSKEHNPEIKQHVFSEIEFTRDNPVNNEISLSAKGILYYFLN